MFAQQAEKNATEYSIQLEAVSERLEEQDGLTSAQVYLLQATIYRPLIKSIKFI